MSQIAKDQIAAAISQIEPVTSHAVAPFGYGSDISCERDLDPNMAEVPGGSTLALAQAIVRRLDCPRGALPDDPSYGIDLRSHVNRGVTADEINQLGGQVRLEVLKDDRVDSVTVKVTPTPTGSALAFELAILPVDASLGSFSLTLSASSSEVLLEEIRSKV